MLENFKTYYKKAKMMQELKFQGKNYTKEEINDDLIWNVPIYDVVNRRFASFSSFPEAIRKKEKDPKGNGNYYINAIISDEDFAYMCYLLRLCGSGINYIPKTDKPFGTHGFGNFWIVDMIYKGYYNKEEWIKNIPENGFCDVKGYLLPMISKGIRNFIIEDSLNLYNYINQYINNSDKAIEIKKIVDKGNEWLLNNGFKRQNFVLTAYAMDLAEYFPNKVDQSSDVYVGSNAKKCLNTILPKLKHDYSLRLLCDVTGGYSKPYDMEDVACDFIRYINNFQSNHHIIANKGIVFKNNIT